jgi:hypothetical protein
LADHVNGPVGTARRQRSNGAVTFSRRGVTRPEQHLRRQNYPKPALHSSRPLHSKAHRGSHSASRVQRALGNLGRMRKHYLETIWWRRGDPRDEFSQRGVTRQSRLFGLKNQPNPPSTTAAPWHSKAYIYTRSHNVLGLSRTLGNLGRPCEHPLGTVWSVRGPLRRAAWVRGAAGPDQHFPAQTAKLGVFSTVCRKI